MWEVEVNGRRFQIEAPNYEAAVEAARSFAGGQGAAPAIPESGLADRMMAPTQQQPSQRSMEEWQAAVQGNPWVNRQITEGGLGPMAEPPTLAQSPDTLNQFEMGAMTFGNAVGLGLVDDVMDWTGHDEAARNWRGATEVFREANPGTATALELAGGAVPALAGGALTAIPKTAAGRIAAGVGAGALEGELAGIGYSDPTLPFGERAANAIPFATITGALGGAVPAAAAGARAAGRGVQKAGDLASRIANPLTQEQRVARALEQVSDSPGGTFRATASSIYDDLTNAGLFIAPNGFDNAMERLVVGNRYANFESVNRVLAEIANKRAVGTQSFMDIEELRQFIGNEMRSATNPNELNALSGFMDGLDDYVNGLDAADLLRTQQGANMSIEQAREMVQTARENWAIGRKLDVLEEAQFRASTARGDQTAALQNQIRRILNNPKQRRAFSADEIELMVRVAGGDQSAMGRFINALGWMAPTGWASLVGPTTAIATGNVATLIPPAIGAAAKRYGSAATQRAFDQLQETIMRSAGGGPPIPLSQAMAPFEGGVMGGVMAPMLMDPQQQQLPPLLFQR